MATAIIAAPAVKERLLVAAIDFGTTYSGYAYSFRSDFQADPLKISSNQWQFGASKTASMKTPSCILFNSRQECDCFGFEAENKYAELCLDDAHHDWFFFRHFKMLLYDTKVSIFDPIIPEFLKWTFPQLNLDMIPDVNRGFNMKYKKKNRIANKIDPDEKALYEPSHLDLHCLYRYLFWSAGWLFHNWIWIWSLM